MQKNYNKPKTWQDFELLCEHLFYVLYGKASRNGRQGQSQHGVDIYGTLSEGGGYFGVQCKCKNNNHHSQITEAEIDAELNKAIEFKPSLSLFIFATTTERDSKIQEYIRSKNDEFFQSHKMHVSIYFWDCIEEMMDFHKEVGDWYEGVVHSSYAIDIKAVVANKQLQPKFNRVHRDYVVPKDPNLFYPLIAPQVHDIFHLRPCKNHSWCEFDIEMVNIGETVLEDYSLDLQFEESEVKAITNFNDNFSNNILEIEINKIKTEKMELFHYKDNDYALLFEPKNQTLVQKRKRVIRVGILPRPTASEIHIKWKLLARNFDSEGLLEIPVVPLFIDISDIQFVPYSDQVRTEDVIEDGIEFLDRDDELHSLPLAIAAKCPKKSMFKRLFGQ